MASFNVYFDASGAPDDCAAVVVAGFVAKAEQWMEFQRNWEDALRAYGVSELHMRHYAHSLKEYASWKGDHYKRRRFLERLINIIKTRALHSFVNSVMMDGYRRVDERYCLSETNKPYALSGIACIDKVRKWADRLGIGQKTIAYLFEDGDKDKASLTQSVEHNFRFTPIYLKKSDSCIFQASDLLAYEHLLANRKIYAFGSGVLAFEEMRHSLQALNDIPHGREGECWGVYDAESIEMHCKMNKYPLRI